eukprot:gb/GEZJ01000710.1/.p1 GENE.gb/GEZJ01000710.1/~~gb/GEZJ01000710.1/.p1  ORF type:complete len:352 (+),score=31.79 gb/GEZJ01000710.1/:381-1436(+)
MGKPSPVVTVSLSLRELFAVTLAVLIVMTLILTRSVKPQYTSSSLMLPPKHDTSRTANQQRARNRMLTDLPACAAHGRANTFLMFFMGHSGSTAIMTSLQQHSGTYINGFEPVDHGEFRNGSSEDNARKALAYTTDFFRNASEHALTSGFKIRPLHVSRLPAEFAALIRKYKTRIIWSYRSNVLKQAIGDYGIFLGDNSAFEGLKIEVNQTAPDRSKRSIYIKDLKRLHTFMKSRVSGDEKVLAAIKSVSNDQCVLPVSYESFFSDPDLTMLRIQRFLGLNDTELHQPLRAKANPDTVCDLAQNWEHLCEAFFGCSRWRWMLDDFENGCSCSSLRPSRFGNRFCSTKGFRV